MDWLFVVAGLVILLIGGDVLVRGAVALAARLGIPTLIVSLTVVAFGTSAPELLIAIKAGFDGVPELALGNVVGSNTANVLLVLGVPALLFGLSVKDRDSVQNFIYMMLATVAFIVLTYTSPIGRWQGVVMLLGLASILYTSYRAAMSSRSKLAELESEVGETNIPTWKMLGFLIAGLVSLPLGAGLLVDGAVNISRAFHVPEEIIGLTLVALGTSLPELATTVMAALRKEGDVAIGNVLGSNIFNLLGIVGVASLFGPMPVPSAFFQFDLWVMLASSLVLAPFIIKQIPLSRIWGMVFLVCYGAYVVVLLT
ncbi:sodium:calcium antiporter [Amylibacter marinus]|uniref:Sodium:calcium antiporter n=1 Tax=Amylibacter marinus TaxID=1475483 RepID=A0ABQ5VX49_9RHOB|nr:calcium/sodium antiporter [Amylibacter marinus]GLQ35925.1 sodium:calcium antiporter [Amylibacter marinus]